MAIEFTQKTWVDYPDTSTLITAAELNRIENAVGEMAVGYQTKTDISETITTLILNSINALHPDYTVTTFTETVETEEDTTMTCILDLSVYNPDNNDGLLITADDILISTPTYTVSVENNSAVIRFFVSAGLKIGQTVIFYVYHKPQNSSSGTVVGEVLSISDGSIAAGISGTAEQITDEEET